MSSICGGIISQSKQTKDMKRYGVWANAMAYVLPDKKYKEYVLAKKNKNDKLAQKIFDKYAISQI